MAYIGISGLNPLSGGYQILQEKFATNEFINECLVKETGLNKMHQVESAVISLNDDMELPAEEIAEKLEKCGF